MTTTATTISRTEYLSAAQKALATAAERALTLLTADGYTIEPYADRPGVYSVARPVNDPRPLQKGESLWNDVDVINQDCTCECFRYRGGCKHLIATNKAIAEAARLMAPMLPTVAETTTTQTSPRPERGTEAYRKMIAADFG